MAKQFLSLLIAACLSPALFAKTEIQWWHAMGGALEKNLEAITDGFNASQDRYEVIPVNKGNYRDTMTAAISAFRAQQQPTIVQVYEVGTATMMAAKGAIYPVEDLITDYGGTLDKSAFLPAVISYYETPEGKLLSMPFNSSTPVLWINRDMFAKAGIQKPPKTWAQMDAAAAELRKAGFPCGYTTAWQSWVLIENYSAWNNLPMGTEENGFAGFNTRFTFNNPQLIHRLQTIKDSGNFVYGGRNDDAMTLFLNQKCAMFLESSASYSGIAEGARFAFENAMMPYDQDVVEAPQNSIIGGATLWVLRGKSDAQYEAAAAFLDYLSKPEVQAKWHQDTGYVPITTAAYRLAKEQGYYKKNPYGETAIEQLALHRPTVNSRGIRFGNMAQIRDVINTELETLWSGKKTAREAMDAAVKKGNALLRAFEKENVRD